MLIKSLLPLWEKKILQNEEIIESHSYSTGWKWQNQIEHK